MFTKDFSLFHLESEQPVHAIPTDVFKLQLGYMEGDFVVL
jgi:hypothetical protein